MKNYQNIIRLGLTRRHTNKQIENFCAQIMADQKNTGQVNLDDILPADDVFADWGDGDAIEGETGNADEIDIDSLIFGGKQQDEKFKQAADADGLGDFFDNLYGQNQSGTKPANQESKRLDGEMEQAVQEKKSVQVKGETGSASQMFGSLLSYLSQEVKNASSAVAQNTTNIASSVAGASAVTNLGASLNAAINAGMGVEEDDEDRIFNEDWNTLKEATQPKKSQPPVFDELEGLEEEDPLNDQDFQQEQLEFDEEPALELKQSDKKTEAAPVFEVTDEPTPEVKHPEKKSDSNNFYGLFGKQDDKKDGSSAEGNFMGFLSRATSYAPSKTLTQRFQAQPEVDHSAEMERHKKQKRPFIFKEQGKSLDVFSSVDTMNAKVMQHLINENKKLRLQLAKKNAESQSQIVQPIDTNLMRELESKNEDFDAEAEFNYLQTQYDLHNARPDEDEATALYTACFFTKDFAEVAQQKIELFKCIARRALVNQQLILQSSSKKVLGKDSVLAAIRNNYLKVENKKLKATNAEQEDQLRAKAEEIDRLRAYYGDRVSSLKNAITQVSGKLSALKQLHHDKMKSMSEQMVQLKSANHQQNVKIINILTQHARKQKQTKDEVDSMILSKNSEISKQFMQMKQLKEKHEVAMSQLESDLIEQHKEATSKLVFQKNNEINRMHTEQMATKGELEALQREHEEAVEMQERLNEESAALKQQIRSSFDELDDVKSAKQEEERAHQETKNQLNLFTQKLTDLQQSMMDKEDELQDLHEQLQGKNDEIAQIEEEIDQYAESLQQKEEIVQRLEAESAELKIELSSSKLLNERVQELEQLTARLTQENDMLHAQQALAQLQPLAQPTPIAQLPLPEMASVDKKRENGASISQNSQKPSQQDETAEKQIPQNEQMHLDFGEEDWGGLPGEDDPLGFLNYGAMITAEPDAMLDYPLKNDKPENTQADEKPEEDLQEEGDYFEFARMQTAMNAQLLGQLLDQVATKDEKHEKKVGEQIEETIRANRHMKELAGEELDDFLLHDQEEMTEAVQEQPQNPESVEAPEVNNKKKNKKRNKRGKQKSINMNALDLSKLKQSSNFAEPESNEVVDYNAGVDDGYQQDKFEKTITSNHSLQGDLDMMNEEERKMRKSPSTPPRFCENIADILEGFGQDNILEDLSPAVRRSLIDAYGSLTEQQQKDRILLDLKHKSLENLPTPRTIERLLKSVKEVKIETLGGGEVDRQDKNASVLVPEPARADLDGDFNSSVFPDSIRQAGAKDNKDSFLAAEELALTMGSQELEQLLAPAPATSGHHRVSELINEGDQEDAETSDREILAQRLRDQLERSDIQPATPSPFQDESDLLVAEMVGNSQRFGGKGDPGTPEQLLSDLEEELEVVPDKGSEDSPRPATQRLSQQRGKSIEIIEEVCEEEDDDAAENQSGPDEATEVAEPEHDKSDDLDQQDSQSSPMPLPLDDELALGLEDDAWGEQAGENRVSLPDVAAIAEEERRISPAKPEDDVPVEEKPAVVFDELDQELVADNADQIEMINEDANVVDGSKEVQQPETIDIVQQDSVDEVLKKEKVMEVQKQLVVESQDIEEQEVKCAQTAEKPSEKKFDLFIKGLLPDKSNPAIFMIDESNENEFMPVKEFHDACWSARTKNPLQKTYEYIHPAGDGAKEDTLELTDNDIMKAVIVPTHQFSKSFSSSLQSGPATTGRHKQIMAAKQNGKSERPVTEREQMITNDGGSSDQDPHGDEASLEEIDHSYKESEFYSPPKLRSLANDGASMMSRDESSIAGTLSPRKLAKVLRDLNLPQINQESTEPVLDEEIADISEDKPMPAQIETERVVDTPAEETTPSVPVFTELDGLDMDEPIGDDVETLQADAHVVLPIEEEVKEKKQGNTLVFNQLEGFDDDMMGFQTDEAKEQPVETAAVNEQKPPALDFDFAELDGDLAFADETAEQDNAGDETKPKANLEASLDDILGVASEPASANPTKVGDAATAFLEELSQKYSSGATPEKSKPQVQDINATVDPFAGVVDFEELAIDMDGFAPFEAEEEKQPVSARIEHSPADVEEEENMIAMDDEDDNAFDALFDSVNSQQKKNQEMVQAVSDAEKDIMAMAESVANQREEQLPDAVDDF